MTYEGREGLWWMAGSLVVTVVVIAGVVSLGPSVVVPGMWAMLPVICWVMFRKVFNTPYLSPTTIVAAVFVGVAVLGYSLRDVLSSAGGASVSLDMSDETALRTLQLISVAAALLLVSSGMAARLFGGRPRTVNVNLERREQRKVRYPGLILLGCAVPLVVLISSIGIDDIMERTYYILGERGSALGSIGAPLATAVILVLGYAFGASKANGKFLALALLFCYAGLLFSYGSRRLAMIPILFAVGVVIANNTRKSRIGVAIAGLMSFAILPLPLEFRGNATHGITPYLETFSTFSMSDVDWLGTLNNILVAFPIIGESAFGRIPVYMSDIIISMNPMPGTDVGWYEIYPRLRLNFFTPMAGIGELGHVGWSAVVPFFLLLGVVLAWMEIIIRRHLHDGSLIYVGLVVAVAALFALQMIQYNLRSATRLLVYLAVVELARMFWVAVMKTHAKPENDRLARALADQERRNDARRAKVAS